MIQSNVSKFNFIQDPHLVNRCEVLFDLANENEISHEQANAIVLSLLYKDTEGRHNRKSGDTQNQGDK